MSISEITAEEMMDDWMSNPSELLAFFNNLLWKAKIQPNHPLTWQIEEGKIIFYGWYTNHVKEPDYDSSSSTVKE